MVRSKRTFAQLLTEGIYSIRLHESKPIQVIQDELGFALGRDGGSPIEYWRRGYQPSKLADLELLAQLIQQRGKLQPDWLETFLFHGGHPYPAACRQKLLVEEIITSPSLVANGRLAATVTLAPPQPQSDLTLLDELEVPGGTVRLDDPFYIEREVDVLLKNQILRPGSITTIRAPRQTGKSSLLIRGAHHARQQGATLINLDLQRLSRDDLATLDTFLHNMAQFMSRRLRLPAHLISEAWQSELGPSDKLTFFLEDYVLNRDEPAIVLAIDEADRLLETSYHTDFFALLRAWHNQAAYDPLWEKLRLALVISTETLLTDCRCQPISFQCGP